MKKWIATALLVVLLGMAALSASGTGALEDRIAAPSDNNGKKWRIGYSETDPFGNFAGTFYAIVQGLERSGWISGADGLPYTDGQEDSLEMWEWLASRDMGPYIEFVADAHYSLLVSEPGIEERMIERLRVQGDIDLMLAMGTYAGQVLANDRHQSPVMVFSSSNAVQSGIIASETDSGRDHVWAHMDADRYKRQVGVFHDIFRFRKLGMIFEHSELGRIYAAIDDVMDMAERHQFEVVTVDVREPVTDEELEVYYEEVLAAAVKLSREVDAVYLTAGKWDPRRLPELLAPFYERGVPVFSQLGQNEVRYGALLSLYRADFSGIGYFGAQNFGKVLNGAKPRELSQIYGDTPSIVLNLEVAERIGYRTPFDILLVADRIFLSIDH